MPLRDSRALTDLPPSLQPMEALAGPALAALALPTAMALSGWAVFWGMSLGLARALTPPADEPAGPATKPAARLDTPAAPAVTAPRLVVSNAEPSAASPKNPAKPASPGAPPKPTAPGGSPAKPKSAAPAARVSAKGISLPKVSIQDDKPDAGSGRPQGLAAPRAGGADDLKRIAGIGPKIETILNGLGIHHFDQVAAWTPREIAWVDDHLKFNGRILRDQWIAQAEALAVGEEEYVRRFGKPPR